MVIIVMMMLVLMVGVGNEKTWMEKSTKSNHDDYSPAYLKRRHKNKISSKHVMLTVDFCASHRNNVLIEKYLYLIEQLSEQLDRVSSIIQTNRIAMNETFICSLMNNSIQ